jgi:hypothetical protein
VTLFVIALNAVWIWVDCDYNSSPVLYYSHPVFIVIENLFCTYFFGEWMLRFCAFKLKNNCLNDRWFCFDSFLVALLVFETWVITLAIIVSGGGKEGGGRDDAGDASVLKLLRLLRLSRTARMTRLLQHLPELMIMVKGLAAGLRSTVTTLFLLFIMLYIFGIAFRQLTTDTPVGEEYFWSVPESMMSLLVYTIFPDMEMILRELYYSHPLLGGLGLLFTLLATLMVLNLLVGILVEAVSVVAHVEK